MACVLDYSIEAKSLLQKSATIRRIVPAEFVVGLIRELSDDHDNKSGGGFLNMATTILYAWKEERLCGVLVTLPDNVDTDVRNELTDLAIRNCMPTDTDSHRTTGFYLPAFCVLDHCFPEYPYCDLLWVAERVRRMGFAKKFAEHFQLRKNVRHGFVTDESRLFWNALPDFAPPVSVPVGVEGSLHARSFVNDFHRNGTNRYTGKDLELFKFIEKDPEAFKNEPIELPLHYLSIFSWLSNSQRCHHVRNRVLSCIAYADNESCLSRITQAVCAKLQKLDLNAITFRAKLITYNGRENSVLWIVCGPDVMDPDAVLGSCELAAVSRVRGGRPCPERVIE